jgi:hypothetical protein
VRLRSVAYVAVALALLSGLAWLTQRQTAELSPVLSSAQPPVVAEPVAAAAPAAAPAVAPDAPPQVDPAWVRATARRAGLSEVAVAAYGRAVLSAPQGCGVGWTTLAGLGWVESHQGTIDGRTLDATGRPSTPIIGPALDGAGPVAAIRATPDGTALHGDATWDHAVGPLQFLPSTWATWGRDGDGDGTVDPQDLDDAAAAAAAYLCGTGYDLTTGAGWSAAVFAYNHSASYVSAVNLAAVTYAERAA